MTNETKQRIEQYTHALPGMKERVAGALVMLAIAMITAVTATYAWVTISRAPEVSAIATTMSANGSLEIALSKEDGSQPDEYDIDESVGINNDVTVKNLQWGNLINLSDPAYGLDNLALRPAQLNDAALLANPLWGAVYGGDGRITRLDTNYAYARYNGSEFLTSNNTYGVRAIASYEATIADATQQAYEEKLQAVTAAHANVNQKYSTVPGKFASLGTMVSKYAQDKLDSASPGTNLAPYLGQVLTCYNAVRTAMLAQRDAYVALANFQNYMYVQNNGGDYVPETWAQLAANHASYNAATPTDAVSANGIISLVSLSEFINDLAKLEADIGYLNQYKTDYEANGTPYYWGQGGVAGHYICHIVADLIDYGTMTIDLNDDGVERKVTSLNSGDASAMMSASGSSRKVYVYNGILKRFEQSAVAEAYRLNGNAACTIKVSKSIATITIYGKAYTKAAGACNFMTNFTKAQSGSSLVANDAVAKDTYGLVVDLWVRTNAEETCLTLEGAVATNEDGTIVSYDGINRVWGSTNQAVLTTDSTTQGGGSCYIYYADTPEDTARSLDLLEAMKVAFVNQNGVKLATASMDTVNYYAVNGRITVPLVLDTDTQTTYTYTNELNETVLGRAVITLNTDTAQRIEAIVYLDGTKLTNDNVLAAAEIQGQLNIQFGSSVNLRTVGDNKLINDTRSVSATISKNTMDYDNAVTDDDLTTDVVVRVDGASPHTVTAFFVRAINSTQGTREATMTFTSQPDGSWTSSYTFAAPGSYYLRYIRMDGVDYALADPQQVEVSGFSLASVTWGEQGNSATIRTSDDTYAETIAIKFASSDPSKMPSSVQARFVRTDGNIVNIPLSYSSSSGQWTGTGTFGTSGVYTLRYLVFDSKYKDLESQGMTKTLDLALGMYVEVRNGAGSTTEQYEAGHTYSKDVTVQIFDNTGNAMAGLDGARLIYSNGGSATSTINTDLVWSEVNDYYTGTLPIVKAGRYKFASVQVLGNYLTKCPESPVYAIISPDPPVYQTSSTSTYHHSIQFAPLTSDAVIDNVYIANAESASVSAVVYNDLSDDFYELNSEDGSVYFNGTSWTINLPTYTLDVDEDGVPLEGALYTQEGTWSVVTLKVWDCYDADGNSRAAENPIVWVGTDSRSVQYANSNHLTADVSYDFGSLSSKVSCTLKVQMVSGTTALGSSSAPFMARYPVSGVGMYALLTDDAGNVIPADKVGDVTLNINYTPNPNDSAYGYRVLSTAAKSYAIKLNTQDAEDGHRTLSEVNGSGDFDWQYVGVYAVQSLKVTIGSTTRTYTTADNIGIPASYTVTTAAPSADNIALLDENIQQRYTVLGKTGDNVTGTFLQKHDPGVTAKMSLTTADNSNTQYVVMDGVSVQMLLTYQNGKTAPNGGYSWSDISPYESVTIDMTNSSGTYMTSAYALLAGTYKAQLKVTVGDSVTTKNLSNVSVYSKAPTVKVTGVSPSTDEPFQMNTYTGENVQYYKNAELISVQNYYTDTLATVYVQAESGTAEGVDEAIVDYTLPTVTLTLGNIGNNFASASVAVPNSAEAFAFAPSGMTATAKIGTISTSTFEYTDSSGCTSTVNVPYEVAAVVGEQTINAVTVKDTSGVAYTVSMSGVTIRERNTAPAAISYVAVEGYTTPAAQKSVDGGAFEVTLPTSIGTTTSDYDKTDDSVDWETVSNASQNLTWYKLKSSINDQHYSGGCNVVAAKHTATFTYTLYTRTTLVERKTSTTQTYRAQYGVVGWKIGSQTYAPGETVTINGVSTATPVIGVLSETPIGTAAVTTIQRTTISDTSNGTQDVAYQASSKTSDADAKALAEAAYTTRKPAGYEWFDAASPTTDGHLVIPTVETVTLS